MNGRSAADGVRKLAEVRPAFTDGSKRCRNAPVVSRATRKKAGRDWNGDPPFALSTSGRPDSIPPTHLNVVPTGLSTARSVSLHPSLASAGLLPGGAPSPTARAAGARRDALVERLDFRQPRHHSSPDLRAEFGRQCRPPPAPHRTYATALRMTWSIHARHLPASL
jgi:hypothetical protein